MRRILYLRIPHFHTTLEAQIDPRLAGQPRIVAAGSYQQGVVVDVSPEAAARGAARGMSWRHARRRCPDAALIRYEKARYAPAVEQIGNLLYRYTPWVEMLAEDEFFADLGEGAPEEGARLAREIQARLREEMGFRSRLALATGKTTARAAGLEGGGVGAWVCGCVGVWERRRDGESGRGGKGEGEEDPDVVESILVCVPPGKERAFLRPLPVEHLWDLKPEALRRLHLLGLRTLGQLADLPARAVAPILGPAGPWYRRRARGVDRRAVRTWEPAPAETAACLVHEADPDRETLDAYLQRAVERISEALVRRGCHGRSITLVLHLAGDQRLAASRALKEPARQQRPLLRTARDLLTRLEERLRSQSRRDADPVPDRVAEPLPEAGDANARAAWRRLLENACESPALARQAPKASGQASGEIEALELVVGGLEARGVLQLSIFDTERHPYACADVPVGWRSYLRAPALRAAIARLQDRYGEQIFRRGEAATDERVGPFQQN